MHRAIRRFVKNRFSQRSFAKKEKKGPKISEISLSPKVKHIKKFPLKKFSMEKFPGKEKLPFFQSSDIGLKVYLGNLKLFVISANSEGKLIPEPAR